MKQEIGSEFEMPDKQSVSYSTRFDEFELTFSGRTSIQLAIRDLVSQKTIQSVWLPSYCCNSMIQPFYDLGIPVKFYEVNKSKSLGVNRRRFTPQKNEAVFSMAYFGFSDPGNNEIIELCISQDIPVIEDCTHSLLSANEVLSADYRIASLRKWFSIATGGYVKKKTGNILWNPIKPNEQLINKRIEAMKEKANYLKFPSSEKVKNQFLTMYRECNDQFACEYQNVGIDDWSRLILNKQDVDAIRNRRRENASILLEGLNKVTNIRPLFSILDASDCPLYVPVVLEKRDLLQKWLATRKIYCPAHWPRPCMNAESDLYSIELSLICDQRYGQEDMEKILDVIISFSKEK